METFKESVVVITGASSGIGRALAVEFSHQGAKVVLAARDENALQEAATECQKAGGKALIVPTDVAERDQCEHLMEQTVKTFNGIDVLINNAGISMWAYFSEMQDLTPFEKMMQVNYLGSVYCTYFALPHLKKTAGRLVAISSLAGKNGVPTRSGYAASKHAMVGFFDTLRIELAGTGVTTTVIYPGFVATEIRKRAYGRDGTSLKISPIQEDKAMPADVAAKKMMKAIAARNRELVMTARGKIGQWIKLLAPDFVDKIARKAIEQGH